MTALKQELSDREMTELLSRVRAADQFDAARDAAAGTCPDRKSVDDAPSEEEIPCDEYGFPFEPEGKYNCAPLEFEEVVKALSVVLINTNYAAVRYNRLSPNYTLVMQHLEKYIKQMGSYFITKTVLEKSGQSFPGLVNISVKDLHGIVSVHFRKCCMAYNDLQIGEKGQDLDMISWIFRWALLSDRLKATQDKINKIEQGKIRVEALFDRETVYKDEARAQRDNSHNRLSPCAKANSLPILKSYAKEIKLEKQAAEKYERAVQREARQAAGRLKKGGIVTPIIRTPMIRPAPLPKLTETGLNPNELRKLLMDEAKSRGDMAEAGIIAREKIDQLIERFQKLRQEGRVNKVPDPPPVRSFRSGPSDETRKKLREKRKKKN